MTRTAAWSVHLASLLVGLSGLVYGVMRYLLEPADEFSLVNHPAQPAWQGLHVLSAPLLVFACGWIWEGHVWRRVKSGFPRLRTTGLALFLLFFPMTLSGVLVQVAADEPLHRIAVVVHAATGALWCLVYPVHFVAGLVQLRRGKTGPAGEDTAASSRAA